ASLLRGTQVAQNLVTQRFQPTHEFFHTLLPLLVGHAEVAEADRVGSVPPLARPYAGVQTGIDVNSNVVGKANLLPSGHWHQLAAGHTLGLHDTYRLIGADQRRPSGTCDAFGSVQMIKMRVPNNDPIGPVHLV